MAANENQKPVIKSREATIADHDGILAIGVQYGGLDYLQEMLESYLMDPRRYCTVTEINGHVIGFGMAYNIDGGKTVVGMTGRLHPDYHGRGIFKMYHQNDQPFLLNPLVRLSRSVVGDSSMWRKKLEDPNDAYYLRLRRKCINVVTGSKPNGIDIGKALKSLEKGSQNIVDYNPLIRRCYSNDLLDILTEEEKKERLFSSRIVMIDWEPYELMEENFGLITDAVTIAFASLSTDGQVTALSVARPHQCPAGLMSEFDYYGDSNHKTFALHMIKQLECILPLYKSGDIYVTAFSDNKMDMAAVQESLKESGFKEGGQLRNDIFVVEKPMEKMTVSNL